MTKDDFLIFDKKCKQAIVELKSQENHTKWIQDNAALHQSVSIKNEHGKSKANILFENFIFLHIGSFHGKYESLLYEENILNCMSQEEAILYFIEKMDIYNIDRVLEFRHLDFINYLKDAFIKMRLYNNWLSLHSGKCYGMKPGRNSYRFVGNVDKSYIDILIEIDIENNRILNIKEYIFE